MQSAPPTPNAKNSSVAADPGRQASDASLEPKAIIQLRQVSKVYGTGDSQVTALNNVSLDIMAGEFLAVMGPSGSGKSTLLHCAAALDKVSSGSIFIDGQNIDRLKDAKLTRLRAKKIGFVFQAYNLIPFLNARQNILLPLQKASLKKAGPQTQTLFDELVRVLGIGQCLERLPRQLSGGQQQKVAIARALITRPAVVFADEPTGNLDSKSSAELLGFLRLINQNYRQTIIMITHSAQAASYARRIIFIKDGCLIGQMTGGKSVEAINRGLTQLEQMRV